MKLILILGLIYSIPSIAQREDSLRFIKIINEDSIETSSSISASDSSLRDLVTNYNEFVLKHSMEAYKWQLLSAKLIFFVSILIVICGLYLSYLQFKSSQKRFEKVGNRARKKEDGSSSDEEKKEVNTITSLHLGKEGIKVDSAVIGLVILVVSIVYFFLYLRFAFQIRF